MPSLVVRTDSPLQVGQRYGVSCDARVVGRTPRREANKWGAAPLVPSQSWPLVVLMSDNPERSR